MLLGLHGFRHRRRYLQVPGTTFPRKTSHIAHQVHITTRTSSHLSRIVSLASFQFVIQNLSLPFHSHINRFISRNMIPFHIPIATPPVFPFYHPLLISLILVQFPHNYLPPFLFVVLLTLYQLFFGYPVRYPVLSCAQKRRRVIILLFRVFVHIFLLLSYQRIFIFSNKK